MAPGDPGEVDCVRDSLHVNSEAEEELVLSTAQQYDHGPFDAFTDPIKLTHRLLLIIH